MVYRDALTGTPAPPGAATGSNASFVARTWIATVRPLVNAEPGAEHDVTRPVLVVGEPRCGSVPRREEPGQSPQRSGLSDERRRRDEALAIAAGVRERPCGPGDATIRFTPSP